MGESNASAATAASRILVTGGAGFLGLNLVQRLLDDGERVCVVDNFFTSSRRNVAALLQLHGPGATADAVVSPVAQRDAWAADWAGPAQLVLLEADVVIDLADHDWRADLGPIRCVYHLACPAAPGHYQYNPVKTTMTAIWGTKRMLELAEARGVPVMIASTSEVYGDPEVHPQTEDYWGCVNPIGKRACYDEGKRAAETFAFDYIREHDTDVRVVRIFNTYGPWMHPYDGRVVSNFIRQALNPQAEGALTIFGDGSFTRSFQFVSDLVEGFVRVMAKPKGFHGPVNLGNPREFTILQLARMVVTLVNNRNAADSSADAAAAALAAAAADDADARDPDAHITFLPSVDDDPKRRKPDISMAKRELDGWEPAVPLEDGLVQTIKYFAGLDLADYTKPTPNC